MNIQQESILACGFSPPPLVIGQVCKTLHLDAIITFVFSPLQRSWGKGADNLELLCIRTWNFLRRLSAPSFLNTQHITMRCTSKRLSPFGVDNKLGYKPWGLSSLHLVGNFADNKKVKKLRNWTSLKVKHRAKLRSASLTELPLPKDKGTHKESSLWSSLSDYRDTGAQGLKLQVWQWQKPAEPPPSTWPAISHISGG